MLRADLQHFTSGPSSNPRLHSVFVAWLLVGPALASARTALMALGGALQLAGEKLICRSSLAALPAELGLLRRA